MPDERWRRVKDLIDAALERPAEARETFLRDACSGDDGLRREVESLLAARREAGHFFSQPARAEDGMPTAARSPGHTGEEATSSPRLAIGTRLGPYEVVSFLAAGGMGEVYKARDARLDRTVAIKVLPEEFSGDPERLRRFERESRAAGGLNHPNVLVVHDVGAEGGVPYLVSEYLEGETLAARLRAGMVSVRKALDYGTQIARGLAAAHGRGVVHRDIKPANVLVTREGLVKILDFGLAKPVGSSSQLGPDDDGGTAPGAVLGTVSYMSPEQVRGQAVDHRSDIFSLGIVLYQMLSGHRPFDSDTAAETMSAILKEDPKPLRRTDREVPSAVESVVLRCLEKQPDERFQSARDLAFALEAALQGLPTSADQDEGLPAVAGSGPGARRLSPRWWSLSRGRGWAALAVAAVGALVWTLVATRPEAVSRPAIESVAVLPFVNDTGEADAEYLGDGLAESVINTLSAVPNLRVAARTSAFRYKKSEDPPEKICRDLSVAGLLTGRIVRRGQDLIVQVDLVEGQRGFQLWGGRYARKATDLLVLQEEIARDVASRLDVRLGQTGERRLAARLTADPEAYRLYLLGRFHWNQRTTEGVVKALDDFKRAAERDPAFALAYAGQAEATLTLSVVYGVIPPRDGYPAAKAAALKALSLAPDRAESHEVLGYLSILFEGDPETAERELRRALELDPRYETALQRYAYFLVAVGRGDEAMAQIRQAEALDPASFVTTLDTCLIDYYARRFDEGIAQCRKVLEMHPGDGFALWTMIALYQQKGQLQEAGAALHAALEASGGSVGGFSLGIMASYYVRVGRPGEVRKLLVEAMNRKPPVRAMSMARLHAVLGETERALVWLERARADREMLMFLNVDMQFDPIRADPRFREFTRRIGLPDAPPPIPPPATQR